MSFDDLPTGWQDHPLDDTARAADVIDLFVGHADREAGCVCFLLLDEGLRLAQPLVVDAVPEDADPAEITAFLREVLAMTASGGGGLVFARGRDGTVLVTDADRRWHEAVLAACRAQGVRLVGAFLATPATVRTFPQPLEEAVAS